MTSGYWLRLDEDYAEWINANFTPEEQMIMANRLSKKAGTGNPELAGNENPDLNQEQHGRSSEGQN